MVETSEETVESGAPQAGSGKISIHYLKSQNCAELPVHGVFGGINPDSGQLHMAVFTERPAIPKELIATVLEDGSIDQSSAVRVGKTGIVRMISAVLYYDINTAIALHQWLGAKIETFKMHHPEVFSEVHDDR